VAKDLPFFRHSIQFSLSEQRVVRDRQLVVRQVMEHILLSWHIETRGAANRGMLTLPLNTAIRSQCKCLEDRIDVMAIRSNQYHSEPPQRVG
jgi:hypothetical protein